MVQNNILQLEPAARPMAVVELEGDVVSVLPYSLRLAFKLSSATRWHVSVLRGVGQIFREELATKRASLFSGKLIGGGDDEWELKGPLPETWLTDPPPPPLHVDHYTI